MKILTPSLILVAFALVSCQKKVSEQAAKRDMSFCPLWHGKSLTENEPKSWNGFRHKTNAQYPKQPIPLRWIGTIGPTT